MDRSPQTGGGTSQRSAIGGQQQGNVTFGLMPDQIAQKVEQLRNEGGEVIVLHRKFQSEPPQVWSTASDRETLDHIFRETSKYLETQTA